MTTSKRYLTMRNSILVLCLFLLGGMLKAQSLLDKVPPSPTAASLIGASEISTSKFTGTPNISIPLYQIGYHNMSVPISLSYNAQGIKVNNVPGWVGTNWSLNSGGVITRMINGLPDEHTSGYFDQHWRYLIGGISTRKRLEEYDAGTLDGAPDMYNFSFPGGSGKFFINHNKEIVVFPHQKLKVEFINVNSHIDLGFTITTLDGTVYTFSKKETTKIAASGNLESGTYPSAWYLKSIHTPIFPNKQIKFSYAASFNLTEVRKILSYSSSRRFYTGATLNPIGTVTSAKNMVYNVTRLEMIEWGEVDQDGDIVEKIGSIQFVPSTPDREDLVGEKSLDSMKINGDSDNLIRGFKFTYDYYALFPGATSTKGKLRLDQVQEFDNNAGSNPPYIFSYDPNYLPDYNNTGQDFWGYYNGKHGNTNLLPRQTVDFLELNGSIPISGHYNIGSANRKPNERYLKYGIMESIQYPTGGSSNFRYEINQYSSEMIDNFGLQSSILQGGGSQNTPGVGPGFNNNYDYLKNTFGTQLLDTDSKSIWSDTELTANTQNTTFTTTVAQKIYFSYTLTSIPGLFSYVKVERNVNGTWTTVFDSSSSVVAILNAGSGNILFNNSILLKFEQPAGTYRLTSHVNAFSPVNGNLIVETKRTRINALWYVPTGVTDLDGPGLRIKQISQKENLTSSAVNIRKFEYTNEAGASSGVLYASPIHSYRKFITEESQSGLFDLLTPLIVQNTGSSFSNYGSDLGYSRVTELIGSVGENGKVIDEYRTNHRDAYSQVLAVSDYGAKQYPFAPSVYALWDAGDLLKSTVYRKKKTGESGDNYKKVQEQVNEYAFQQGGEVKGVAIAMMIKGSDDGLLNSVFSETKYRHTSLWSKLIKSKQTNFSDAGVGQTTTTEMTYETTPGHLQLISQSVMGSDGRKTISAYTYPLDYYNEVTATSTHPFATNLIAKNMHGSVIEQLNILEDGSTRKVLAGTITKYNATSFQPEEIYTLKVGSIPILEDSLYKSTSYNTSNALMDGLYEPRITFNYLDGNLIEQWQTGGSTVTYIWGYENQYPVAKLVNATYADVKSVLGENFTLAEDGSLSTTQKGLLRDDLPNAMVTTMTYKLGVGMESQTDPNGLTTTYEYDSFGRLKLVKDDDKNIINTYKYNYKGN